MSEYNCRVARVVPREHLITVNYVSTSLLMKEGYMHAGDRTLVFRAFRSKWEDHWKPWYMDHIKSNIPVELWSDPVPEWIDSVIDWIDSVIDWIILSSLPKIGT